MSRSSSPLSSAWSGSAGLSSDGGFAGGSPGGPSGGSSGGSSGSSPGGDAGSALAVRAACADLACVLAAWLVGYLLRLGATRLHVVTWWPEVAFIVLCAGLTVGLLAWRGFYAGAVAVPAPVGLGGVSLQAARRLAFVVLGTGYGLSAAVRFFDVEIISRTAILLAPLLAVLFMVGWRLALAWWVDAAAAQHPRGGCAAPAAGGVLRGAADAEVGGDLAGQLRTGTVRRLVVVNEEGADLRPVWRFLSEADTQAPIEAAMFQPQRSAAGSGAPPGSVHIKWLTSRQQAFDMANATPDAVVAVPQAQLSAWQQSPHYIPQPGHRLISIETLIRKAQELHHTSLMVH